MRLLKWNLWSSDSKMFRGEQKTSEKKRLSSSSLFISFSLYLNNKNGIWKDKAGTEQIANSSFVRTIVSNIYSEMSLKLKLGLKTVKKWGKHPIYVCSSFIKRTGRENGKLRENMFDHMLWLECLWFNMTTNLNMRRFIIEVVMTYLTCVGVSPTFFNDYTWIYPQLIWNPVLDHI